MNIVQINATTKMGSTGKIMYDLNSVIQDCGNNSYLSCAYTSDHSLTNMYCTNQKSDAVALRKNILISRLTGKMGYRYKAETRKLIRWIDEKEPDILHLHNIHGDWLNIEVLFKYIKEKNMPVVWTLHDCWAFTGRCSHFEVCGCQKWKTGCNHCKNNKVYPITYFFDHSLNMWSDKKEWFTGIPNMTIVTPSEWLADYVKQSFLREYPVEIIHNGINISIYHKTEARSRYYKNVSDKKIILGVASSWSALKGYDDFIELDKRVDHKKYQIVLVGLNPRQLKQLPKTIIGIGRTGNEQELVELYSGADVFVNPTYQDNFPTTNLEAEACGTPVITYKTGGSPESIPDKSLVIQPGNIESLVKTIDRVCALGKNNYNMLEQYAKEHFAKELAFQKYLRLYNEIIVAKK